MRLVGALLIALVAVVPAAAQTEDSRYGRNEPAGEFRHQIPQGVARAGESPQRQPQGTAIGRTFGPRRRRGAQGNRRPQAAGAVQPAAPREPTAPPPAQDGLLIQSELAWVGEFAGPIDGEIDDKTVAAIKSFQRNRKFRETGVLNTQERVLLATAAKARQAQVGWTVLDDPVTGAKIGLPAKQIPNRTQSKTGTRWSSPQGQVQIETFRLRQPGITLATVFEQQKREPAGRKVETSQVTPELVAFVGDAGSEEISRPRRHQGRRGARHDGAVRSGRSRHGRCRRRHGQRLRGVPGRA